MSEPFVTVYRGYDPIEADLMGDLLRDNNINARVTGTRNGAVVGVSQIILRLSIQVPQSQAQVASDFLAAYKEQDGEALLREEGVYGDDADVEEKHSAAVKVAKKRHLLAGGMSVALFGGAHWYASRPWTAVMLAAAQLVAIRWMLVEQWSAMASGLVTFGCVIAFDAGLSQFAVRAYNAGLRRGRALQLVVGAALAGTAIAAGAVFGPLIPDPQSSDESLPVYERPGN